ncbi:MAG: hypothetical protein H0V43_14225 [Gemmatimonadales bacterium]|nr:hypothetical protein [Gemmatimonadales bacterium]
MMGGKMYIVGGFVGRNEHHGAEIFRYDVCATLLY